MDEMDAKYGLISSDRDLLYNLTCSNRQVRHEYEISCTGDVRLSLNKQFALKLRCVTTTEYVKNSAYMLLLQKVTISHLALTRDGSVSKMCTLGGGQYKTVPILGFRTPRPNMDVSS